MDLFTIHCTTCGARLKVRSVSAIGQIVACPKCQSMVQIEAPAGWQPPAKSAPRKTDSVVMKQGTKSDHPPNPSSSGILVADSDFRAGRSPDGEQQPPQPDTLAAVPRPSPLPGQGLRWALAATPLAAGLLLALYGWSKSSSSEPDSPDDVPPVAAADAEVTPPVEAAPPAVEAAGTPVSSDATSHDGLPPAAVPPAGPKEVPPVRENPPAETKAVASQPAEPPPPAVAGTPPGPAETPPVVTLSPEDRLTRSRLDGPIAAIRFEETKLVDVVQFLSRMTAVTMEFDDQALIDAGIDDNQPVSVQLSNTTAARVLDAVLTQCGLQYTLAAGRLRIIVAERPPAAVM